MGSSKLPPKPKHPPLPPCPGPPCPHPGPWGGTPNRVPPPPPPPFTLRVVVSTSQSGVFVMTADRGTDQAVRGGRHGQKLHSGFPPRQGDACGSADARSSADACLS